MIMSFIMPHIKQIMYEQKFWFNAINRIVYSISEHQNDIKQSRHISKLFSSECESL